MRAASFCRTFPCLFVLMGMLIYLAGGCTLLNTVDNAPLTMRRITHLDDTETVYPQLQYVFSAPLADSSVSFSFAPATGSRYGVFLNPTHDTATLRCIEALDGNTRYVIRLENPVVAVNGSRCYPADDSTVLFTYDLEQEPNDVKASADLFSSVIFGTVSEGADIDVFRCAATNPRFFTLQSIDCQDSFYIVDSTGTPVSLSRQIKQTDTLTLPSGLQGPFYVYVLSREKGWEGSYRLGCR